MLYLISSSTNPIKSKITENTPYGVERGDSSSTNTCLGSATATTATPRLDPAASRMLEQYLACVAARCWGRVVFETRRGLECFDFSCRPPNNILATPHPPHVRVWRSQRTADQRGTKREQEKKKRTAWAKERKLRTKAVSSPPLADLGTTAPAAAAPTAAAAAATATTATAAAVVATYCEAAMAMLPTTAAPRAAAEAATRRMRTAAKKEVVPTATAGSVGAVTSSSPPAPPAKRKRKHLQPVELTSRQSRTETERMCAIPLLDSGGDASLNSETASQLATPPPATPPPLTTPSPPNDPATVKNLCSSCMASLVFNYERRICKEYLEK